MLLGIPLGQGALLSLQNPKRNCAPRARLGGAPQRASCLAAGPRSWAFLRASKAGRAVPRQIQKPGRAAACAHHDRAPPCLVRCACSTLPLPLVPPPASPPCLTRSPPFSPLPSPPKIIAVYNNNHSRTQQPALVDLTARYLDLESGPLACPYDCSGAGVCRDPFKMTVPMPGGDAQLSPLEGDPFSEGFVCECRPGRGGLLCEGRQVNVTVGEWGEKGA